MFEHCKKFKAWLAIFQHYAWNGLNEKKKNPNSVKIISLNEKDVAISSEKIFSVTNSVFFQQSF